MDVEKSFHMTGGLDNTSYAKNSSLQKKAADMVKHITRETIQEIYRATTPKSIGMADLGCSSGPNTLSVIKEFIHTVEATSHKLLCPPPEFRIHLNDLPSNDFNSIFQALPDFYTQLKRERVDSGGPSVFISANPGSFYGRLFPNGCLHFIYSSYCLHWLSKVPPGLYDEQGKSINKGSMYVSKSSPPQVLQAYYNQFQDDFSLFLKLRSQELVKGGKMVLIFLGRSGPNHVDRGNSFLWEALSRSLATLASRGEIEEEKIDSYDVHFYAPCKEEIEKQVRKEGSFEMDRLEMFELEKGGENGVSYGTRVAMTVRAIQESMISHHFGKGIVEDLFEVYRRIIDEEMAIEEIRPITFVLVLRKR